MSPYPIVAATDHAKHQNAQRQQPEPEASNYTDTEIVNYPEEENSPSTLRKRKLQQVSTQQARVYIDKFMIEDKKVNGIKGLFAQTIRAHSGDFSGLQQSNRMKSRRWWKHWKKIFSTDEGDKLSVNHHQGGKSKNI